MQSITLTVSPFATSNEYFIRLLLSTIHRERENSARAPSAYKYYYRAIESLCLPTERKFNHSLRGQRRNHRRLVVAAPPSSSLVIKNPDDESGALEHSRSKTRLWNPTLIHLYTPSRTHIYYTSLDLQREPRDFEPRKSSFTTRPPWAMVRDPRAHSRLEITSILQRVVPI